MDYTWDKKIHFDHNSHPEAYWCVGSGFGRIADVVIPRFQVTSGGMQEGGLLSADYERVKDVDNAFKSGDTVSCYASCVKGLAASRVPSPSPLPPRLLAQLRKDKVWADARLRNASRSLERFGLSSRNRESPLWLLGPAGSPGGVGGAGGGVSAGPSGTLSRTTATESVGQQMPPLQQSTVGYSPGPGDSR